MTRRISKIITCFFTAIFITLSMMALSVFAADVKLNKTSVSVVQGKTVTLSVSGTSDTIKWSSADKNIATVSKGVVKGVSTGTTTITAAVGGTKLTCKVTVNTNKIVPKSTKVTVTTGKIKSVDVAVKGVSDITCTSSDKDIASAKFDVKSGTLKITGYKSGTVKIKLYSKADKNISAVVSVTVENSKYSSKALQGKVDGNVYKNQVFNMQFKLKGFTFLDNDDAGMFYGESSDGASEVMFCGTINGNILIVENMDISGDVNKFGSELTSKVILEDIVGGISDLFPDYETSTVTIAGKKYESATYDTESFYLTVAMKRYGDRLVVMYYINYNYENDFDVIAKGFTEN